MKTMPSILLTLALAAGLTSTAASHAAPPPCDGSGPCGDGSRREERQREIAAMHARVLKERVGLDDKRVGELQKVHAGFRGQRQALKATLKSTQWALVALVKADSADNAAYEKALGDVKRTREQLFTLQKTEREAVARLLSPREQARLFVAMQEIRKHRKHGRRHGPAMGPGHGGPPPEDGDEAGDED